MSPTPPRRRSPADRIYGMLLLAYPRSFRRRFGRDMAQLFRDRRREVDGGPRATLLWWRTIRDTVVEATLERISGWGGRRVRHALTRLTGRPTALSAHAYDRHTKQKGLGHMLDAVRQDIGFSLRTFARNPGFTAIATITLALGIGANTAIFSVINGVLLKPLRFGDPNQLVVVWETSAAEGVDESPASIGIFTDWRERTRTFEDLTTWAYDSFILQEGEDESVSLTGVFAYPNFFSVLQVNPLFGRTFVMDDAEPGRRGNVVVISHALWRDRWGADPGIVGSTVHIDGRPVTIVGVMGPDLAAPRADVDLWMPAQVQSPIRWERHSRSWVVYGRVADGVTLPQVQDDLARIATELATGEFSDIYEGWSARAVSLREEVVGNVGATLIIAFASVGLVLLIACVNIANMLLARAAARQREIAVRTALGAGRARIARQLLTESVLLGLGGGGIGVVFALATHNLLIAFEPGIIPRAEELALDAWALLFALVVSVMTGVLFGLVPALHSANADIHSGLKQGSTRISASRGHSRLRAVLVSAQLALATVLLSGAGLLLRSMQELGRVDPGFNPNGAVVARMFLDGRRYNTEETISQYATDLRERLRALPITQQVGATSALPMDPMGINYDLPYRLEGQEALADNELPSADFRVVTPGYFAALEVPLIRGRAITESDRQDSPFVAVVNQSMADQVWPGRNPVGQRFYTPSTDWHWFEVVGIVADTRYYGLDSDPRPEMYVAHAQVPRQQVTFVVRTHGDPAGAVNVVRRAILAQDPAQPTHGIVTMESLVSETIAAERFYALVLGIFAGVALILSGAGIYGVLSYWVSQRTHEIGVRMAMGATGSTMLRLVVGHGMSLTGIGLAVGIAGALVSTRVLANALHGVGTTDPATFISVAIVLGAFAFAACVLPAWRASRVDPMVALREE